MEREKLIATVTAAQNGDSDALNTLFNAFYNDVYYFALKTVKDDDLACDITQETFVEIINTIGDLHEPAAFVKWMKQITYHQCTRYFKKKKDVLVDEDEEGNTVFDTLKEDKAEFIPDEALDQQDFRDTILAMLDELSEEQRSATMLYYYDEMSVKQIAEIQNVSEGTVKSRLNYARKSIKNSVETYEKKNGVKLHCAGVLPLLLWLLSQTGKEAMPAAAAQTVAGGVTTATGVTVSAAAASAGGAAVATATATAVATTSGVGIAAKIAALPVIAKAIAGVVAGSLVIGAAVAFVPQKPSDPTGTDVPTYSTQGIAPMQSGNPTQGSTTSTEVAVPSTGTTDISQETTDSTQGATGSTTGSTTPSTEATTPLSGQYTVPEGCTYETLDGRIYQAGQSMPVAVSHGDNLITPEYTYRYNDIFGGWSVRVHDKSKTEYGPILSEVNGTPVVSMLSTFENCVNLTTPPAIPNTVTSMSHTFTNCTSLKKAPEIPVSVTDLTSTFQGCTALIEAPVLPDNEPFLWATFQGCIALTVAPEIPASVTLMPSMFSGCTALKAAPILPHGIEDIGGAFSDCIAITEPPIIPNTVKKLNGTFSGCTALRTAPQIPASVTDMSSTFNGCTALEAAPSIPSSVTTMTSTFEDCILIVEAPVIPQSVTTLDTTFRGCTSLIHAPTIPASVQSMIATFSNCTSLIGEIEINATIPEDLDCGGQCQICRRGYDCFNCWACCPINDCFAGTAQPIVLTGSCSRLQDFPKTVSNHSVTTKLETGNEVFTHVPAGCTYITANGITLPSGTAMPANFTLGDQLITADYTYEYIDGWFVTVNDKTKAVYAPIPDYISGIPVRDLTLTFEGCRNMTQAPAIPKLTYSLNGTFMDCSSLTTAPAIPDLVEIMDDTFSGCTSLREVSSIGNGVTSMNGCFSGCAALASIPAIPEGVLYMNFAFRGCIALETVPALPNSVTNLAGTFMNCTALQSAPALPENADVIQQIFSDCSALEQAPVIPAGVTDMMFAFQNCTNLTGTVEIHATPQSYTNCFAGTMKPIILSGSSDNLKELATTASSGNVTVQIS